MVLLEFSLNWYYSKINRKREESSLSINNIE